MNAGSWRGCPPSRCLCGVSVSSNTAAGHTILAFVHDRARKLLRSNPSVLIETGDAELARRIIAPHFVNQEADDDPDDPGRQLPGPAGFLATSQWLRDAFPDLRFELQEALSPRKAS